MHLFVTTSYCLLTVLNVSFAETSISVREGVGEVRFILTKSAGAVGPVSVRLFTNDDTALGLFITCFGFLFVSSLIIVTFSWFRLLADR